MKELPYVIFSVENTFSWESHRDAHEHTERQIDRDTHTYTFFNMVSKSQGIGKLFKCMTSSKVRLRTLLNWWAVHGVTCLALNLCHILALQLEYLGPLSTSLLMSG